MVFFVSKSKILLLLAFCNIFLTVEIILQPGVQGRGQVRGLWEEEREMEIVREEGLRDKLGLTDQQRTGDGRILRRVKHGADE